MNKAQGYIKIYGERNAGTNYLDALIHHNMPNISILNTPLGWKHKAPDPEELNSYKHQDITTIVTITKNPYAWLLSMYRKPYHYQGNRAKTFLQFLKAEWKTLPRDNCPDQPTPIHLWNTKTTAHLKLANHTDIPVINLTYEQLLLNPTTHIKLLAKALNTALNQNITIPNTTTKGTDKYTFDEYQKKYLTHRYHEYLKARHLIFINEHLDHKIRKALDYPLLD